MKTGRTLNELAAEITRQQSTKRDFVVSTASMAMSTNVTAGATADWEKPAAERRPDPTTRLMLHIGNEGGPTYGINEIAHDQLATFAGIPGKYYDRMRNVQPALLAENVNTWLHASPAPRLVRVLDDTTRAFLSSTYRPLENYDLAEAVLPVLADLKLEVWSAEITERRLYLKCVNSRILRDIPKGAKIGDGGHTFFDTCCPAIQITNSEVGIGALSIETGMLTRACTNLAWFSNSGMRKRHVGARNEISTENIAELLSDDTRRQTDKAIWMQVRDVVRGAFNEIQFNARMDKVAETAGQRIEADPVRVVEFSARKFGWNNAERDSVLKHLVEGADLSRYGLFNAVTRTAEDCQSYDRASEFEKLGAHLIDLPASEWKVIANAVGDPLQLAA